MNICAKTCGNTNHCCLPFARTLSDRGPDGPYHGLGLPDHLSRMGPHWATWGHMVHFVSRLDIWSHVGGTCCATCATIGYTGAFGFKRCCCCGGRSYRQFGVPLSVWLGTPTQGGVIANCVPFRYDWERRRRVELSPIMCPLSVRLGRPMKGGAVATFCVPLVLLGTPMKGGAIANFEYPSRYDWERR